MQWMPDALIPWHGRWVAASRVVRPCGEAAPESPRVCSRCWGCRRVAPHPGCRRSAPTRRDRVSAAIAAPGPRTPVVTRRSSVARTTRMVLLGDRAPARRHRSAVTPWVRRRHHAPTAAAAATGACRAAAATSSRAAQTIPISPADPATACGRANATSRDAPARGARVTVGPKAPVTTA